MQKTTSMAKNLLAMVWLAAIVTVSAQTFKTSSYTYYKGGSADNFTVDVLASTDVAIGAYTVKVAFDKDVINLVSSEWKAVDGQVIDADESKSITAAGKANTSGSITIYFSYDAKSNAIPAGTKDGVVATLTFAHVDDGGKPKAESLTTGKAFDFAITASGAWEASDDGSSIDTSSVTFTSGAFNVVKAFNAADVADEVNDWDGSAVTVAASKFVYTDDKSASVTGKVTKIGSVTCSVGEIDFGTFATTKDGGIKWTPAAGTKAAIGHAAAVFTVPFTATGDKGSDDATLTLTVNPANAAPVLKNFSVTKNTEDDYFVIELTAEDADGDAITFSDGGYMVNGAKKNGAFASNVWTSNIKIGFDEVAHPAKSLSTTFTCSMTDGIATVPVEVAVTLIDKDQLPVVADFSGASVAITPASPKVTDTLTYKLNGAPAADADGDVFDYTWTLSKDAPYVKGDVVTITAYATTNPYGDGKTEKLEVASNSVTVVNSAPVITDASPAQIFIQKGVATSASSTITATDADGDTLTYSVVSNDTTKGTAAFSGNVLTYTVTDTEASEVTDTITIKANDGEADSAEYTVTLLYCENPLPEITSIEYSVEVIPEVDEEGEPFSFTATVTATDKPAGSVPAAVGALTVTPATGLTAEVISTEGDASSKTYTVKFTTNGYNTIVGVGRPTSDVFDITYEVVDDESKSTASKVDSVTIKDVDRLPSAPTALNPAPEFAVYGDELTVEAAGAQDADGDMIDYTYAWSVSTDGGANYTDLDLAGKSLKDNDVVKKGNMIKVVSKTVTEPYGDGEKVYSESECETIWTIGNTAPWFKELGDQSTDEVAKANLEYTWTVAENSDASTINVLAFDVDAEGGVDSLTYSISELDAEIGTIAVDEAGVITFTPAANYNNADLISKPTVEVTVVDESGANASNTAIITLDVTEVNAEPSVDATPAQYYLLPSEIGVDYTVSYEAFMGENEDDQELTSAAITGWDADFFEAAPTTAVDGKTVSITFKVKGDADLIKGGAISFTVTDNGTTAGAADPKTSEAATFMVFGGASPWYPVITIDCVDTTAHADGHTFHLVTADETLDITVKGGADEKGKVQLLPIDYQIYGFEGFKDNTDVDVTVYVWTNDEGTTDVVCAESEVNVAEYGLPGEASSTITTVDADENGYATLNGISVPLAKNYNVIIEDAKGNVVTEIGPNDFESDEDGMIISEIDELTVQLPAAGEYTVKVQGINPNGEGETVEVLTINVPQDSDEELSWTDGYYSPADGEVLTNGTVRLSWPVATNAVSYDVVIYGANGSELKTLTGVTGTSTNVTLPISESPVNYTWKVIAYSTKDSLVSETCNFTLATTSKDAVVTDVMENPGDTGSVLINLERLLDDSVNVTYRYQYFSVTEMKWYNGQSAASRRPTGDALVLPISGASVEAGDYIALLLYQDGRQIGDWIVYEVQADGLY